MPKGEHSHKEKYITRIITRQINNQPPEEYIQFICEADGIIFQEVKIINN